MRTKGMMEVVVVVVEVGRGKEKEGFYRVCLV
jgi:hypothetical protein